MAIKALRHHHSADFHVIIWNLQQFEPEIIKDREKSFIVFIKTWTSPLESGCSGAEGP